MEANAQQQQQQQAEQAKQAEEQRQAIINAILSAEAKERLGRIKLVKPEKSRLVEDLLLRMRQQGQLSGPVSDEQLLQLLNQISDGEQHEVKIAHRGKLEEKWDDDNEGW